MGSTCSCLRKETDKKGEIESGPTGQSEPVNIEPKDVKLNVNLQSQRDEDIRNQEEEFDKLTSTIELKNQVTLVVINKII